MKTIEYDFNGQTLHLCLNGAALFDFYDKYGNDASLADAIKGGGKKAFQTVCWMLAEFSTQGELVRRYQGYSAERTRSEDYFRAMLKPTDVMGAKRALMDTIASGFAREEDNLPHDPLLAEYQKKTEKD